ncbi:MAG: phenylalanine--tRNA ligase subunit alpha [Candidatus Thorarchaeota archaeon]
MNNQLVQSLHPLERKVLLEYKRANATKMSVEDLMKNTGLDRTGIMRASEWLSRKSLIAEERTELHRLQLTKRGKQALELELPERRMARIIANTDSLPVKELLQTSKLSKEEYGYAFGFLKKNAYIQIQKGRVSLSSAGKKFLAQGYSLEEVLKKLMETKSQIKMTEKTSSAIQELLSRGLIIKHSYKRISVALTDKGQNFLPLVDEELEAIDKLTPDILISNEWQNQVFRPYDIGAAVPPRTPGKRHYYRQVNDYIREIWLSLGFEEMSGPIIQPTFWTFDALFTPQDHPARDEHDSFYIKHPATGKLPSRELVNAVKKTHENGGNTGSLGWRYKWSENEAKRNVLRPHTTVLSARTLAKLREEDKPYPRKFFSLGRNFRNEKIDWKHLAEFDQTDGIVVDPNVTFRHHIGYLKTFFSRLGFPKARFRPGYFPYTEPSMEIDVYHPIRKEWVEFGGTGVFRPEVVEPLLGEDIPVLAWGPGLRMVMDHYEIDDMRRFYEPSLGFLRKAKLWLEV